MVNLNLNLNPNPNDLERVFVMTLDDSAAKSKSKPGRNNTWNYLLTGWRDAWRANGRWANILIVAGICLPILILLGLKRGLVEQFRNNLLKSPTARELQIWATKEDLALTLAQERKTLEQIPQLAKIIPSSPKVVELRSESGQALQTTFNFTEPGDPFLAFHGVDVLESGEKAAVISKFVADQFQVPYRLENNKLKIQSPTNLLVRVLRNDVDGQTERTLTLRIKGVYDTGSKDQAVGFLDRKVMNWLQDFVQGRSVTELGWPGSRKAATPRHGGYLAFSRDPYQAGDLERLKRRGLSTRELNAKLPEDQAWSRLYGLLKPHDLHVYHLTSSLGEVRGDSGVSLAIEDVKNITDSDDLVYPWTEPQIADIDGKRFRVIGVSGEGLWLRAYYWTLSTRLTSEPDEFQILLPNGSARWFPKAKTSPVLEMKLDGGDNLRLTIKEPQALPPNLLATQRISQQLEQALTQPTMTQSDLLTGVGSIWNGSRGKILADDLSKIRKWWPKLVQDADSVFGAEPIAVLPADLLAHLAERKAGRVRFDRQLNLFVVAPGENPYYEARAYAVDLDAVPLADEILRDPQRGFGYSVTSMKTQVLEMQGYAEKLDLLFYSVVFVVFGFGVVTIVFVHSEATARRRGAIGVMRLMGIPPRGIFGMVFARAVAFGLFGGFCSAVFGWLAARLLTNVFQANCVLEFSDLAYVFAGSLICCFAGVLWPAWKASRLDPAEAITMSRS